MPRSLESGGAGIDAAPARAGQRVTLLRSVHHLSVATADPKVIKLWRPGALQLLGASLEDVAGEVNRYSTRHIVLASVFQQARFTGTASPRNLGDWLKALERIYAVHVVDQGARGILLQSRADNGAPQ